MFAKLEKSCSLYLNHYSGLKKPCWFIIFLQFINSILISICYFLPLYFVNQLHFKISIASYIISFYSLGTIAGGAIGGNLADKISSQRIAALSLFFQGIAFLLLPHMHSYFALIFNLFFLGIATYSFITTNFLWALENCCNNAEQKIKTINILDTVSNLGLGIAALIFSLFVKNNLQNIAVIAGIIFLAFSGYVFKTHSESKLSQQTTTIENNILIAQHHSYLLICLVITCLFLIGLIISQLSSTYSIYLNHLFPSVQFNRFGFMFALNTLMVVILQTPVANYCKKYNRLLLIGVGAFLLGFGMFMLIFSFSFFLVSLACVVYTTGEILFFSVAQLICYENAPPHKKGFILGIYRMAYSCSRIIGPATGGYIYQQFGSNYLWYLCGAIGSLCLLFTVYFHSTEY